MSAKNRSLVKDFLVYLVVRCVVCVLQCLSFRMACRFGEFLAYVAYHVDRRHRLVALDNLRHAFPGQHSEAELDALVRRVYRHFCVMLMEVIFLPRVLHRTNNLRHMQFRTEREGRLLMETILLGRPVLFVTGHFGNWELSSHIFGLLGFPVHAIARPLDNRFLDRWLRASREAQGQKILAKNGDFEEIQTVLARGGMLGTLADQDSGPRGVFVDFFHRPASTHKAVALLALEHKVPILVVGTARVGGPLQYEVLVEDVFFPEEYESRPDALKAMTQRFTAALERMVRSYPEQYFWLHRRWKHQPAAARKRAA